MLTETYLPDACADTAELAFECALADTPVCGIDGVYGIGVDCASDVLACISLDGPTCERKAGTDPLCADSAAGTFAYRCVSTAAQAASCEHVGVSTYCCAS